jgi:hypothetical protein
MAAAEGTTTRTINAPTQIANPVCTSCLRKECPFGRECVNLHDDDGCNPGNGRLFGSKCTAADVRQHTLAKGDKLSEPRKVKAGKEVHIVTITPVSQPPSLYAPPPSHDALYYDGINQDAIFEAIDALAKDKDEAEISRIIDAEYGQLSPEEFADMEEQCDEAEFYDEFASEQERLDEIICLYCNESTCQSIDDMMCCHCGKPFN